MAMAYDALGRRTESDARLAGAIAKFQTDALYQIALVYAFRGQRDQAFEWLNRAYTERDAGLSEIKCDPLMNALKHDPRYEALLRKLQLF